MMLIKIIARIIALSVLLLLAGCGGKDQSVYRGPVYPPVTEVTPVFQPDKVGDTCMVFAHALFTLPGGMTGRQIAATVAGEAGTRGADTLLIGLSRKGGDPDMSYEVAYFGPNQTYICKEGWCGWKYGYDMWEKQKDFVTFGYAEWVGEKAIRYPHPLVLQVAYARCR